MNDQNNNVLNNIGQPGIVNGVQPSVIPEVKEESVGLNANSSQINMNNSSDVVGNNNLINNSLNNGALSFDLPPTGSAGNVNTSNNFVGVVNPVSNNVDMGINNQVNNQVNLNNSLDNTSVVNTNMVNSINNGSANNQDEIPSSSQLNNSDNMNTMVKEDNIVSVKKYLGHLILFSIPIVGVIMLIVKAFDKKDKNIGNLAKAQLIFTLMYSIIVVVITVIATMFFAGTVKNTVDNYDNSYNYGDYDYDDYIVG